MLSVIIPTWNGMRHLPTCIDTLLPQLPGDAEVLVIDNGSSDGTAAWLRGAQAPIRHIRLADNQGFAGGVNTGLRAAHGELLLLLNDDAFVQAGCVAALLQAAQQHSSVGAFAGVLLFAHRPELVASAGIEVRTDGVALDYLAGQPIERLPLVHTPVFGASGGLALLRRRMLTDVGLLEGSFFNYLEDVDLAWRAQLHGWATMLIPAARALHVYSATAGHDSPFKQRLLGRNRLATLVRCVPGPLVWHMLPHMLGYDALAMIYGLASRQPAIAQGRIEALCQLPALLAQRQQIQAGRRAALPQLRCWLRPSPPVWMILRGQHQLRDILEER